jgi:hypothetical protein
MKEMQISPEGNPRFFGRKSKEKRKEIQIKSFHFLRRIEPFQRLTSTPAAFFVRAASALGLRQRRRCVFASGCSSVLLSSFRGPPVYRAREGLAPFLGSLTPRRGFRPTCGPLSLMSAKTKPRVHGSPGHKPGDRGPARKTGRSIRCPARIRPLGKSPNRFRAFG